jgi:hypothetical protein
MRHIENEDETIPGALDGIRQRLGGTERRVGDIEQRMAGVETLLTENTAVTREIRDVVTAGRLFTRAVKWAGAVALAVSALYAVWYQFTHDGRLPPH